ncbi:MAG: guanylate kinase [Oscillatoria sp. PMC 1051.18]|nr:guanylate kinase [Oscillatoria sp. PMC 1050.18]MEC5030279.1 guanylate kinase [Oscillatoria sp. PMC 1051.18]
MTTGKLIVLTGPSGVGKGTLVRSLLARHPELYLSVSATTRTPRPGEVEGKDYYFLSREQFEALIHSDNLLEWAEYAGNYYGTPKACVIEQIEQGGLVILEIEVVGARQIKQTFLDALLIFILPPSVEELERRLRGRGKDSSAAIEKRLKRAVEELAVADEFDLQVVNDNFEVALEEIETAIFAVNSES